MADATIKSLKCLLQCPLELQKFPEQMESTLAFLVQCSRTFIFCNCGELVWQKLTLHQMQNSTPQPSRPKETDKCLGLSWGGRRSSSCLKLQRKKLLYLISYLNWIGNRIKRERLRLELTWAVEHWDVIGGQLVIAPHSHQQGAPPPVRRQRLDQPTTTSTHFVKNRANSICC